MKDGYKQTKDQHSDLQNQNNPVQKKDNSIFQFVDNRPETADHQELQRLMFKSPQQQQAQTVQRMATHFVSEQNQPIQLAQVDPVITAGTKATSVTLNLNAGDHVPAGSIPSVNPDGWTNLQTLGLTKPGNSNDRKWVRFHALNEHAGGPGTDTGNLTSASAEANHDATWSTFETELKSAVPDNGGHAPQSVAFAATITYPGSAASYWRKHPGNALVTTDAADYPNDINATLSVNGVAKTPAHLTAAEGLGGPEKFKKIANWKRKTDNVGAYGHGGTDLYPLANAWDT